MTALEPLIRKLHRNHSLSDREYLSLTRGLMEGPDAETAALLSDLAVRTRNEVCGNVVFLRGLIEFSSFCRNDCLYCGLRKSNRKLRRYRLTPEEILACAEEGHTLGFRTFVLQSGEDSFYTDEILIPLIRELRVRFPDSAITLSLGERSRESYEALREAGADRYLLRHETASPGHYAKLHPPFQTFGNRMKCLKALRETGYQVGCGFMTGSPFQTAEDLAADLKFIETFRPEMCGIGPFIPHRDTPFGQEKAGTAVLTCALLSVVRLILPDVLLPSTTALGTIHPRGRELGLLAGANVVMPNLSPVSVRKKYELYDGKICTGDESAQCVDCLEQRIASVHMRIDHSRGDSARLRPSGADSM